MANQILWYLDPEGDADADLNSWQRLTRPSPVPSLRQSPRPVADWVLFLPACVEVVVPRAPLVPADALWRVDGQPLHYGWHCALLVRTGGISVVLRDSEWWECEEKWAFGDIVSIDDSHAVGWLGLNVRVAKDGRTEQRWLRIKDPRCVEIEDSTRLACLRGADAQASQIF